jgi:hypothetical protein
MQSCQVSRFTRESPGFRADLQVSRLVLKISRILTKIQLAKILSVRSKENPYVFVKWEIKKRESPQFVVQIKVVVQYSRKNGAIFANNCSGKFFLTPKGGGGRSPILICSEKIFFGSGRAQSENYELKAPTTSRFLII